MIENRFHHLLPVEHELGDLARGAAMPLVAGVDAGQGLRRLFERREPEQPFAAGQKRARTGMLHDRRLAARQVAQRAIADPGVLELHARRLGAAEFPARAADVGAVQLGRARRIGRVPDVPAVALEQAPVLGVRHEGMARRETGRRRPIVHVLRVIAEVERQLQPRAGHLRQRNVVQERHALVVLVADALAVGDPLVAPPARDGRERRARGLVGVRPFLETDRRPDVDPGDAAVRKQRAGGADRLTGREIDVVSGDAQLSGADPELEQARIDVHQGGTAEACEELLIDAVVEIQEEVGGTEDPPCVGFGQPGVLEGRRARLLETDDRLAAKTVVIEPPDEAVETVAIPFAVAGRIVALEPVHVAADAAERLRVLHVHPEMPAQIRGIDDVMR